MSTENVIATRLARDGVNGQLPDELIAADAALHALLLGIHFSPHLNPLNVTEARLAFAAGAPEPPLVYAPATWAPDALAALAALRIPRAHPLGAALQDAVASLRLLIVALRDRTAEAFDALAVEGGWYAPPGATPAAPELDPGEPTQDASWMRGALADALAARGLADWTLLDDPVMSARVLVDGAKRLIRVNPVARFRLAEARSLVAHEIDVHAARAAAGARQRLRLFEHGLAGALETEEGLAIAAEARVAGLPRDFARRQAWVAAAVEHARTVGFRDLYEWLRVATNDGFAWGVALRVKRGLADPGGPGVYAKDTVYARGFARVARWLADGNDPARLYVGKVGLDHPVEAWRAAGWVVAGTAPALWTAGASHTS